MGRHDNIPGKLRQFFQDDPMLLQVVSRRFSTIDVPNIHLAIEEYVKRSNATQELVGYAGEFGPFGSDFRSLLARRGMFGSDALVGPVGYRDIDIGVDHTLRCVENGIHLISANPKLAVHVRYDVMQQATELEIAALRHEDASSCLEQIKTLMAELNVYRGKIISLASGPMHPGRDCVTVSFQKPPEVSLERIVLPAEKLELIKRNTVGFFEHVELLQRAGRSTKRGLLLYGKPGTGKTFTIKWLTQAIPDLTVLVLSGEQLALIKECCQIARMLAPSMVIMEDVDLVATHRDENKSPSAQVTLHQILNEMDGMADNTQVLFVMTTNRPAAIEPALAARPGRIDQAIEYPLPDNESRRRLLRLYSEGLDAEIADEDDIVRRTDGASPAFIQELLRKALLLAAEENGTRPVVRDEHVHKALQELLFSGGELTRQLLGFSEG